jgi:hypothetical protein
MGAGCGDTHGRKEGMKEALEIFSSVVGEVLQEELKQIV